MKTSFPILHRSENIDGLEIFYREAGPTDAPTIVLLHGFPSSSHMFRDLIAALKSEFHLIAPDYPGFGLSASPDADSFAYTFDSIAAIVSKLLEKKGLNRYFLYMQDYGGPVGLRIAVGHPDRVAGIIAQNANAYAEGVSELLAGAAMPFWKERTAATEAPLRGLLTLEGVKMQYLTGVIQPEKVSPAAWVHDLASLSRPGNDQVQLALLADYQNNLPLFERWQTYFRSQQPPTLIAWGRNDPFFTEAGALAYQRDLPKAEVHLLETGHFALEDHASEIAELTANFVRRHTP